MARIIGVSYEEWDIVYFYLRLIFALTDNSPEVHRQSVFHNLASHLSTPVLNVLGFTSRMESV